MKYYSAYQMTKNKMHEVCGTFEGQQKYIQSFSGKIRTKEITSKT
jgi:hypothetical protein